MGIISAIIAASGIGVLTNGITLITNSAANIGTYLTVGLGVVLIVVGLFFKIIKKLFIYPLFKLLSLCVSLLLILALITSGFLFIYGKADTVTYDEDYLVVLGCGLNGTEPSLSLKSRLNTALSYLENNTDCTVIVSGGQGNGEDITEAEAMSVYLTEHGITRDRIIKEESATSTSENFKLSNLATNGVLTDSSAALITNDFHVFRANSLAKLEGLIMTHLGAKTPPSTIISSYLRECLALAKMYVFDK